jgi:hypothetical protein
MAVTDEMLPAERSDFDARVLSDKINAGGRYLSQTNAAQRRPQFQCGVFPSLPVWDAIDVRLGGMGT